MRLFRWGRRLSTVGAWVASGAMAAVVWSAAMGAFDDSVAAAPARAAGRWNPVLLNPLPLLFFGYALVGAFAFFWARSALSVGGPVLLTYVLQSASARAAGGVTGGQGVLDVALQVGVGVAWSCLATGCWYVTRSLSSRARGREGVGWGGRRTRR